jgi:hypothetical protein
MGLAPPPPITETIPPEWMEIAVATPGLAHAMHPLGGSIPQLNLHVAVAPRPGQLVRENLEPLWKV